MADTNSKMLQFKMGEWTEGFDNITKSPGTVYITTNEKAMYVDVDNDTRIRIGDIIQIDSVTQAKPPFSTEALYYFVKENALLKWGEFGVDAEGQPNGTMAWQQLNSVSDIVNAKLGALTERVEDTEEGLTTLNQQINGVGEGNTGLVGRITVLEGEMDAAEGRLTATEGVANAAQAAIGDGKTTGLLKEVADLKEKDNELTGLIEENGAGITSLNNVLNNETNGLVKRVGTLEQTTTNLKNDLGTNDSDSTAFARIKNLEDDLADANEESGKISERVETLEKNYSDLSDAVSQNGQNISALSDKIGDDNSGLTKRVKELEGTLGEEKEKISTLQSSMTTVTEEIGDLKEADNNFTGLINGITKDITDISKNAGQLEGRIEDLEEAIGDGKTSGLLKEVADLKGKSNNLDSRLKDVESKTGENAGKIENLTSIVNGQGEAIGTLTGTEEVEGSVKYQIKQLKDTLQAEIDQDINAANAMNYIGSIEKMDDLPKTNVHVGDTYVVASTISISGETTYYAGDLLVAIGSETVEVTDGNKTDKVIDPETLDWNHVKTGYSAQHDTKLTGANNKLYLTSLDGNGETGDQGIITFAAEANSSATVEVAGDKVTIGMAWGSF